MFVFWVLVAFAVSAGVTSFLRERRVIASLRRVSAAEFMASKPPGVADLEWSRLRIAVSRSVGLDPELLDPLQSIDALHRSLAFLGLSAVDVEHIIDDCFEPEDVEAVVSAVRAGKPATFGALMSILAR